MVEGALFFSRRCPRGNVTRPNGPLTQRTGTFKALNTVPFRISTVNCIGFFFSPDTLRSRFLLAASPTPLTALKIAFSVTLCLPTPRNDYLVPTIHLFYFASLLFHPRRLPRNLPPPSLLALSSPSAFIIVAFYCNSSLPSEFPFTFVS